MPTVDPQPWLRRQRDERIAELQRQLEAGADKKEIRKAIRAAHRDYRRAMFLRRGRWF